MSTSETITKTDLTNILNAVIPNPDTAGDSYIAGRFATSNIQLAAGGYTSGTLAISKAGFYPLGVVGYNVAYVSGSNASVNIYKVRLSAQDVGTGEVAYSISNMSAGSVTVQLEFTVLWAAISRFGSHITTEITDLVLTKTSGNSTASLKTAARYGNVMMFTVEFTATASVSAGSNLWTGTINQKYRPILQGFGTGYNSTSGCIAYVTPNGDLGVRVLSASIASGSAPWVRFIMILP